MRYLVTTQDGNPPFLTKWFEPENHFNSDVGMVVYNLVDLKYTTDGVTWSNIVMDRL